MPRILRILRNFHSAGNFPFPFDAPRLDRFLRTVIASPSGAVFVAGDPISSVLVATYSDSPMAPIRCAQEHLIWVEIAARGSTWWTLLDAFEAWASAAGCQTTKLFSQSYMRGGAVGRLFRRRGYLPLETAYSKTL